MRPSFTTLAGMTIAAGSIAIVGASIVGAGTASAHIEPVHTPPITQIDIAPIDLAPIDLGPLVSVGFTQQITEPAALVPTEVGTDAEIDFVNDPSDDYSWIDGDSCPPCGMG